MEQEIKIKIWLDLKVEPVLFIMIEIRQLIMWWIRY